MEENMRKQFVFSIITAVYNVEEYLEEAILSIVNQTIGFKRNVQLILVNDGSPDSSGEICKRYKEKYPKNIVYIEKENGGVSSARNQGLQVASGQYVNFMDSDDKLEEDALEKVKHFFESRGEEIDLVALPLRFFDAEEGNHILSDKFSFTRVVDVTEEIDALQLHCSSTFINNEIIKHFQFNPNLKYGEDAEIVNKIILDKEKYGVIADSFYMYRKRQGESSAIQNAKNAKENYIPVLEHFHKELIRYSLDKKGYIGKYLQNVLLYELSWKIKRPTVLETTMDEGEREEFWKLLSEILVHIEDDIIWNMKNLSWNLKKYLIELKQHVNVREESYYLNKNDDMVFCFKKRAIVKLSDQRVYFDIVNVGNKILQLQGKFNSFFQKDTFCIYIKKAVNGKEELFQVNPVRMIYNDIYSIDRLVDEMYTFEIEIPIGKREDIYISCCLEFKNREYPVSMEFTENSMLPAKYKSIYAISKGRVLRKENGILKIELYHKQNVEQYEYFLQKEIIEKNELTYEEIISIRNEYLQTYEENKDRRIWLFTDRDAVADDNAERLFCYLSDKKDGIERIFIINEEAKAFNTLQQFGKVVGFGTREHKLLTLQAEKIISSHANEITYHPFGRLAAAFSGFMDADRVFLQHGVIYTDLSDWLCKKNKNIKLFITSAKEEYKDIINGNYGYDEAQVALVGMPRYDTLKDEAKKEILFMPTWDSNLIKLVNGVTIYNDKFKESEMFQRINSFLNDERLLAALRQYNYILRFRPHPNLMIQINDFTISEEIEIVDVNTSYQDVFRTGSLLVTDYSSVQFDFAYMKKPVVYYQYLPCHHDITYFDVETMGFGEIVKEQDELIELLISYMSNECSMKEKYKRRVDNFFAYTDYNNCQRVYEAIMNLE